MPTVLSDKAETRHIINVGTGIKSLAAVQQDFTKRGYKLGRYTEPLLIPANFVVAPKPMALELVFPLPRELGVSEKGAPYDAICAAGISRGLQLCPFEVGFQFRIQYPDQPDGEWIVLAMNPMAHEKGALVFAVGHDRGGQLLSARYGTPGFAYPSYRRFAFCLPGTP